MKKENILVIVIISIAMAGFLFYNNLSFKDKINPENKQNASIESDTSRIDWNDYAQGMKIAQESGKHIFLYFHAEWCTYCTKLKKTTFKDKKVLNYLRDNFVSISVDTDKNNELANQWKVRGLPTLWFLEQDSSKIDNIPGYVESKQFLKILKFIHTRGYEKMSFKEFSATI
jgi:thioredoxin-related protein